MVADVTLRLSVPAVELGANPLDDFPAFIAQAKARLEQGRVEYGDKSFDADPIKLIGEMQQEALDLCNWGFIAWRRLEAMRLALLRIEVSDTIPAPAES